MRSEWKAEARSWSNLQAMVEDLDFIQNMISGFINRRVTWFDSKRLLWLQGGEVAAELLKRWRRGRPVRRLLPKSRWDTTHWWAVQTRVASVVMVWIYWTGLRLWSLAHKSLHNGALTTWPTPSPTAQTFSSFQ